ncbi:MAG: MHYT domain-containing protein [Planktothrix sp. GU0601_MAG3]|nr:MAG: MHYT domain-containing protein [Planktothrix sp. GU0601_MAG3]
MTVIHNHYQPSLVAFSFLIAVIASYTALDLATRVTLQSPPRSRLLWTLGGAVAMGTGIWSMHFIGMLALKLPLPVTYNMVITLVSWGVAIIASGLALLLFSRPKLSLGLFSGGVVMGLAIASMHYLGMSGMTVAGAMMEYNLGRVLLSVAIAIIASMVALGLAFYLRNSPSSGLNPWKVCSAGVMGVGISGMHYTGIWAVSMVEQSSVSRKLNGSQCQFRVSDTDWDCHLNPANWNLSNIGF